MFQAFSSVNPRSVIFVLLLLCKVVLFAVPEVTTCEYAVVWCILLIDNLIG